MTDLFDKFSIEKSIFNNLPFVLGCYACSRFMLLVVGLLTQVFILPYFYGAQTQQYGGANALNMWGVWDSGWYMNIVDHGYYISPNDYQHNTAFFPAFPLIAKLVSLILGIKAFSALLVVANGSFILALYFIFDEVMRSISREAAECCVVLLCVMPGSYVYSSAYTESLFLLATAMVLVCVRREAWLLAGLAAALATLTRSVGLGTAIPLALAGLPHLWRMVAAARDHRQWPSRADSFAALRILTGLALPVLAMSAFCLYLLMRFGDPFAFATAQVGWHRVVQSPLKTLFFYFRDVHTLPQNHVLSFVAVWITVAMFVALLMFRRWALAAMGGFFALVALSAGIESYQRYSVSMLPFVIAGAALVAGRPRAFALFVAGLSLLNGFMMVAWTLGLNVVA